METCGPFFSFRRSVMGYFVLIALLGGFWLAFEGV